MTMHTEDSAVSGRDPATGHFVKGNKYGALGRGVPAGEGKRALPRLQHAEEHAATRGHLKEKAPELIQRLTERALEGDVQALSLALRYWAAAPTAATHIDAELADYLGGLLPERRIAAANELAATGRISLEAAKFIGQASRDELEVQLLVPLRAALAALRRGVDAREALEPLLRAADQLEAIDHAE